MTCFDRYIGRAIELAKRGYAVTEIAGLLTSECGSTEQAHLVARAAQVFVRGLPRAVRKKSVVWV